VPFTVTFRVNSGAVAGAGLLYVHDANAAVAASYDPAGGASTVTTPAPGERLVRLPSGRWIPPSHWSATARSPDSVDLKPAVEILWRSGVNWRITRIELWMVLWVKKFLPDLAGKSCQARRRDDKK